ncbi:MAG TPA: FlgD immunoglobulin-like domain containing protein, partial [bacterium]
IVYNTLGKQVKTLVQDVKKTGVHKVIWNGKDEFDNYVSNGCYFIKMQAERFRCIKKLLMIK